MTSTGTGKRRIRIERLDLDLRGIDPATADASARALGPALKGALAADSSRIAPARRLDAGRLSSPASPGAHDLAARIAERIVHTIRREDA